MLIYLPIAEVSVNAFLLLGLGGLVGVLSGMFGVGGGLFDDASAVFYWYPAGGCRGDGSQPNCCLIIFWCFGTFKA